MTEFFLSKLDEEYQTCTKCGKQTYWDEIENKIKCPNCGVEE